MEKKMDLRIQKTYMALIASLHSLLCEKGMDSITVVELCDRAMVRKATFYKHFADKYELLTFMVKELQQKGSNEAKLLNVPNGTARFFSVVFEYGLNFLEQNEKMVEGIMNSSARGIISNLLYAQAEQELLQHFRTNEMYNSIPLETIEMLAASFAGAAIHCSEWWFQNRRRIDKQVVVRQFEELIFRLYSQPFGQR